jgi:hypothetical protein
MYSITKLSLGSAPFAVFVFVAITSSNVFAVLVTFDGAAAGAPYVLNDTFTSEGVDFQVDSLTGGGGGGSVTVGPQSFGTPIGSNPAAYPNNLNLDIDFAGSVGRQRYVGIIFSDSGGTLNLHVNGLQTDAPAAAGDFSAFNGMTINGVSVSVVGLGGSLGRIDLNGDIDRVVIGGQEAWFDNIRTLPIPEPVSLPLVASALLLYVARARPIRKAQMINATKERSS